MGLLSKLIQLVLTPKLNASIKKLENDSEFQQIQEEISQTKKELDIIGQKLEENKKKRTEICEEMNEAGVNVNPGMNSEQIYQTFKSWQAKESNKTGNPEWSKFFK